MSLTKLSLAGNSLIIPGQGELHPGRGRENGANLFYSVGSGDIFMLENNYFILYN
jgi:hypothetical protein